MPDENQPPNTHSVTRISGRLSDDEQPHGRHHAADSQPTLTVSGAGPLGEPVTENRDSTAGGVGGFIGVLDQRL